MKRVVFCLMLTALPLVASAQSSYYHNYKSFFGKEDRVGLFSQKAKERFPSDVLDIIAANTLLVDCGSKGKPATGFLVKSHFDSEIYTAAHNVRSTLTKPCTVNRNNEEAIQVSNFLTKAGYQDSATLTDVGFDVAKAESQTLSDGFEICETIDLNDTLLVPQSYDGKGYLAIPPICRATKISETVITTTCRGHYKASGAPLLSIKNDKVCVAGVFNAHSGSLMNYESYAANMVLEN